MDPSFFGHIVTTNSENIGLINIGTKNIVWQTKKKKFLLHQFNPMVFLLGYNYYMHTLNLKDINYPNKLISLDFTPFKIYH
jgi:hypothetical protein